MLELASADDAVGDDGSAVLSSTLLEGNVGAGFQEAELQARGIEAPHQVEQPDAAPSSPSGGLHKQGDPRCQVDWDGTATIPESARADMGGSRPDLEESADAVLRSSSDVLLVEEEVGYGAPAWRLPRIASSKSWRRMRRTQKPDDSKLIWRP